MPYTIDHENAREIAKKLLETFNSGSANLDDRLHALDTLAALQSTKAAEAQAEATKDLARTNSAIAEQIRRVIGEDMGTMPAIRLTMK